MWSRGDAALGGLLVVKFQQVGDSLVLLLRELDDGPSRLRRRACALDPPGGAAQVSGGVRSRSEWVWMVWRGHAGRHDGLWHVELGATENLTKRHLGVRGVEKQVDFMT